MLDNESNFNKMRNHSNIDFSLIIPTRTMDRQQWLKKCLKSFFGKADHPERVEAILLMDLDDPLSCRAAQKLCLKEGYNVQIIIKPRNQRIFTQWYQCHGSQCSTGKYIWALNDECEMQTTHWDSIIKAAGDEFFKEKRTSVMYFIVGDDTHTISGKTNAEGCCFPIISLAAAEALNGNFPAEISNWGADAALWAIFKTGCPDHIIDLTQQIDLIHYSHHNNRRGRDELNHEIQAHCFRTGLTPQEYERYASRLQAVIRSEVEPFQFWVDENLITKFNAVPDVRVLRPNFLQRTFYHIRRRLGRRKRL